MDENLYQYRILSDHIWCRTPLLDSFSCSNRQIPCECHSGIHFISRICCYYFRAGRAQSKVREELFRQKESTVMDLTTIQGTKTYTLPCCSQNPIKTACRRFLGRYFLFTILSGFSILLLKQICPLVNSFTGMSLTISDGMISKLYRKLGTTVIFIKHDLYYTLNICQVLF